MLDSRFQFSYVSTFLADSDLQRKWAFAVLVAHTRDSIYKKSRVSDTQYSSSGVEMEKSGEEGHSEFSSTRVDSSCDKVHDIRREVG
jgi:hypothetical protein